MPEDRTIFREELPELDDVDLRILALLQTDAKASLAESGEAAGLSAPAVLERIRKLERIGVIRGYYAVLDSRKLGLDVSAFIGVSINYPKMISSFESEVMKMPEVLECHHVTGAHSLLLKVRTWNTATLESLISQLRAIRGVLRTETMVVFSTRAERTQVPLPAQRGERSRASRRNGAGDPSSDKDVEATRQPRRRSADPKGDGERG